MNGHLYQQKDSFCILTNNTEPCYRNMSATAMRVKYSSEQVTQPWRFVSRLMQTSNSPWCSRTRSSVGLTSPFAFEPQIL